MECSELARPTTSTPQQQQQNNNNSVNYIFSFQGKASKRKNVLDEAYGQQGFLADSRDLVNETFCSQKYSKILSDSVVKPKPKQLQRPITININNTIDQ